MIRKSRLLATAAVCCVSLVLGACGGGGDDPVAQSTGASGDPVAGGEGRILTLSEPRTLDPATLGNAYASGAVVGNALYGTLMVNDEAGGVQYQMAESFTSTDDGATFTLKLRPGLVFSDGTPLDATAVKFNWDRTKDPAVGSPHRGEASTVASSEVVDDVTLTVTLTSAVPAFAQSVIASSLNWVASPAALEQGPEVFDENPVGAGPFTLESWTRQADMTLVKNPDYWDAPKPYLDSITLRPALDANQRFNTLQTGGADVAVESNWINIDKAEQAGLPVEVADLSGGILLAMNMRRAPFDDIRARQAIAAALDMEALNLAVYNGTADLAGTLFAETSPFYSDTPLASTDAEAAQGLFDELAAEGKPLSFTFTAASSSENRAIAENVQAQLSAFDNVEVDIRVMEVAELATLRTTHDFDLVPTSAFFQDPEPRLMTVFHGSSPANLPGVDDPALNEALLAGRTATSEDERRTAYDEVQQRLADVTPAVFLARAVPSALSGTNVGGLRQYGLGSLLPEEIWIQP